MKTRFYFILSFLFFLSSNYFFNQVQLNGKVLNSQKQSLSFIKIEVPELKIETESNVNGEFTFNNLPYGQLKIQIKHPNFEIFDKIFELKKDKEIIEIVLNSIKNNSNLKELEDVFVNSTRSKKNTSNTYEKIEQIELKKKNFVQDIPVLLENSVSAVSTSDAGTGVGYTGLRIRGVDPSRTNVTVNGIPINDAESHGVYWVNMPDLVSSVDNIQIQRGVGTSSNGAAAFGASISLQTNKVEKNSYAILDNSIGSFGTLKNSIFVSTGILPKQYHIDIRLSKISSNGFVDRASADLKSYYIQLGKIGKKSMFKFLAFGGKEITYQAWYGVPEAKLNGNQDDLLTHFYNNYYPGGMYQNNEDSINLFSSNNRTYNYYRYKNEVDNYQQHHFQLLNSIQILKQWKNNSALHYTRGKGYYEQFRYQDDFAKYNLNPIDTGNNSINQGDFIRRRWLDNHFYGLVYSLEYDNKKNWNVLFGASANQYLGLHFGEIIWAQYSSNSELGTKYYENDALKNDYNFYLKAQFNFKKWLFFTDLQCRTINYTFLGLDENNGIIEERKQKVDFLFFNPKGGISYQFNQNTSIFLTYSMAQREPIRDDFRENLNKNRPKAEILHDAELGFSYQKNKFGFKINYYLMYYYNQLILTGKINDVGSYTRTNVPFSYRNGVELESHFSLFKEHLKIQWNTTLSQNKIIRFTEFIDDYDVGSQQSIEHSNTDLSFSPNLISSLQLSVNFLKYFQFIWSNKWVGKQYLDNTSNDEKSLSSYFFSNVYLNFTSTSFLAKEFNIGLQVNNIFNNLYENNAYTWGYIYGGQRVTENFYFPQAGTHFMFRISLKL
ncbi:MAG: TonB-dependent receptor [Flavobacteriia bacterium]|nr:TonB-dependent receptor [Flavobacteriia bacterium]